MPTPSPFVMRNILQDRARRFLYLSLICGTAGMFAWYYGYVEPRRKKYVKFFENYDPYVRMHEICSYPRQTYMHTCPSNLVKLLAEKGYTIEGMDNGNGKTTPESVTEEVEAEVTSDYA